ncbi:MAG: hypothetical protein K1X57_16830 [Gemmataceae bacterium]|nr:hypothetical protein [Gemmataceae bacterium]
MMGVYGVWANRAGWAVALLVFLYAPASVSASWLGFKNETTSPVTVQTAVVVNGRVVRGNPHVLYPGEIAWDNVPAPGPRQISVYNPKANNALVAQESINIGNADIFLSVQLVQQPQQPGKAALPPVVRLIATKAPVPPGQQPAKEQPKAAPNAPVPPRTNLPPTAGQNPPPPPAEKPKTPDAPKSPPPADSGKSKGGN